MKEAWVKARRASRLHGGSAKEWIGWALVRAWKDYKAGKLNKVEKKEFKPVLRGRMTDKQESFIESLLRKKEGKYEEDTLIKAFKANVRDNISKQQASNLISYLLAC